MVSGDDALYCHGGDETLYGGGGDDYLVSGYGPAGTGVSRLYGGEGDDDFGGGAGNDLSCGGDGNDFFGFSAGQHSIYGGDGTDTIGLYIFNKAMNFTLGNGGSGTVTIRGAANLGFSGVTNYFGIDGIGEGDFNDTLRGTASNNRVIGNGGADSLFRVGGADGALSGYQSKLIADIGTDLVFDAGDIFLY